MEAVGGARAKSFTSAVRACVYAAMLATIAAVVIVRDTNAAPNWAGDGYAYSIRMQMDAGVPYERARDASRALYRDKAAMRNAEFRRYLAQPYPEYWTLFAPRMLYPWLASLLWPRVGMTALLTVSNVAYVLCVLAVFLLLLTYARPEIAAFLALGFAFSPLARSFGAAALTDMLAVLLWTIAMFAMCRFVLRRSNLLVVLFAVAATALTLTRPLAYMPLCAAGGLLVWAWNRHDRASIRAAGVFGGIALVLCAVMLVLAQRSGAPSFGAVLQQLRVGSHLTPHAPLLLWYAVRVASALAAGIYGFVRFVIPAAGLVLLRLRRTYPDGAVLAGSVTSVVLTAALNPITTDAERVIVFPMLPIAAAGIALGLESLLSRRSIV